MRIILLLSSFLIVSCSGVGCAGFGPPTPKNLKGYLNSDNPEDRLNGARLYYDKGDFKKAIYLFEITINEHHTPNATEVYYKYANSHYALGEYETSASLFNIFYLTYPENINAETAYYYRAKSYYQAGQQSPSLAHHYLIKAKQGFKDYIQAYPNGQYSLDVKAYDDISNKLLTAKKISRKKWKLLEAETLNKIPSITK